MLRHARLSLVVVLVLGLLAPAASASGRVRGRADRVELAVAHLVNGVRRHYGLRPLSLSRRMTRGAAAHSAVMARSRTVFHGSWGARVARSARTPVVGEVIGWLRGPRGLRQARVVVRDWLRSAPHRRALLAPGFRRIGVGRRRGYGGTFFTADLAR